jgi:hypothetical protein
MLRLENVNLPFAIATETGLPHVLKSPSCEECECNTHSSRSQAYAGRLSAAARAFGLDSPSVFISPYPAGPLAILCQ